MTPQALQRRLGKDDKKLLSYLYEKYGRLMFNAANRVLRNEDDAEDAVNESAVKVIKHISSPKLRSPKWQKAYLLAIAKNTAIDELRKAKRKHEILIGESDEDFAPYLGKLLQEGRERKKEVITYDMRLLKRLPEKDFRILQMKYIGGYNNKEIAGQFGIATNSVRAYLSKAKKAARALFNEDEKISNSFAAKE